MSIARSYLRDVPCWFRGACPQGDGAVALWVFSREARSQRFLFSVQPGTFTPSQDVQVHAWNQFPNAAMQGRIWVATVPSTGGVFEFSPTGGVRWLYLTADNGKGLKGLLRGTNFLLTGIAIP